MGSDFHDLLLQEDLGKLRSLPEADRWKLEKAGTLELWASMSPAGDETEVFQARLLWSLYPDEPPSLKFRDPETGSLGLPTAWPKLRGFRPESLDTCVSWTLEGFALHPEWKNDPRYRWDPRQNVLLKVLRILQDELDLGFQGRYGS